MQNYKELNFEEYNRRVKLFYENYYTDRSRRADFSEGEYVLIDDSDLLKNRCLQPSGHIYPEWVYELGEHFGQRCHLPSTEKSGVFIGVVFSYADYYYYVRLEDGTHVLETCCAHINFI